MVRTKVKVTGLRQLDKRLGELTKATARNVLVRTLRKAGQVIADHASDLAPDDPRTGPPDLHTSIVVSPRVKNTVGNAEFSSVLGSGGTRAEAVSALRSARRAAKGEGSFAEMFVGPTTDQFHAHLQEFGTVHHGPQPFMRPAWEAEKHAAMQIIKRELGREIDKAAARAARKAARAAGKV